jgi:hypothetical protein
MLVRYDGAPPGLEERKQIRGPREEIPSVGNSPTKELNTTDNVRTIRLQPQVPLLSLPTIVRRCTGLGGV